MASICYDESGISSEPYNHIDFYSKGGAYKVDSFVTYKLKK